jgi:protein subunit release factor A
METVMVEIRAAEGGADAKSLVREQASLYESYAKREGL